MPNPFIETPAQTDPTRLTTTGGDCFAFDGTIPNDVRMTATEIQNRLSTAAFTCFNEPPIINDPTLDIPWNSPPPVETGCYPLRARAQTTMDPDLPEGLTAEFVNNPAPDKCFPILDLKLNINTIIDQVLSIIVPGVGGGGPGVIPNVPSEFGCCCDEFGSFYLGDGSASPYSGLIGDCIGRKLPPGLAGAHGDLSKTHGGLGVSWDNAEWANGTPGKECPKCNPNLGGTHKCCCDTAANKFEQPRVIGVGVITGDVYDGCIGEPYNVTVHAGTTFSGEGYDDDNNQPGKNVDLTMMNLRESSPNGDTNWGFCDDGRYIPGIAGTDILPSYPANFVPQRICPGTAVTVFGMTLAAAEEAGISQFLNIDDHVNWEPTPCFANDPIITWFEVENAHDAGCSETDCESEGAAVNRRAHPDKIMDTSLPKGVRAKAYNMPSPRTRATTKKLKEEIKKDKGEE